MTQQTTSNLRTCPDCSKDISVHTVGCPHCGRPFVKTDKALMQTSAGVTLWIFIIVIAMSFLLVAFWVLKGFWYTVITT